VSGRVGEQIAAENLIEQAKAMLNKESRLRMLDSMFAPLPRPPTIDSPLAQSTARPIAGEEWIGKDVLRITTHDGKVHCLLRPPEIVGHDTFGGGIATPVTCPF